MPSNIRHMIIETNGSKTRVDGKNIAGRVVPRARGRTYRDRLISKIVLVSDGLDMGEKSARPTRPPELGGLVVYNHPTINL
jgi:hypothetical protein